MAVCLSCGGSARVTPRGVSGGEYVLVAADPRGRVAELVAHLVMPAFEAAGLPFGVEDAAAVRGLVVCLVDLVREEITEELQAYHDQVRPTLVGAR